MNTPTSHRPDVLVIGGGPAGSTIAGLFEKDQQPRFHLGESLLPMDLPILERQGVLQHVEAIFDDAVLLIVAASSNRLRNARLKSMSSTG